MPGMDDPRTVVSTADAPAALGPYNQAIVANGMVFAAGQTPIDPATGQLVDGDITVQTHRVLDNLEAVLASAGSGFDRACHVRVYLRSMDDFAAMNAVYRTRVPEPHPARTTVAVAGLPADALVEIDVIGTVR